MARYPKVPAAQHGILIRELLDGVRALNGTIAPGDCGLVGRDEFLAECNQGNSQAHAAVNTLTAQSAFVRRVGSATYPATMQSSARAWFAEGRHELTRSRRVVAGHVAGSLVSFPVAPNRLLAFTWQKRFDDKYLPIGQRIVDEFNRMTQFNADKQLVSRKNETRDSWFEERPPPADAWENSEEAKQMMAGSEQLYS